MPDGRDDHSEWAVDWAGANGHLALREEEEHLTALHRAELGAEAKAAELALALQGIARLRSELEATRSALEATRSELEATRSALEATRSALEATRCELEATRVEVDELRLPAARYGRLRAFVPTPLRHALMKAYRAIMHWAKH